MKPYGESADAFLLVQPRSWCRGRGSARRRVDLGRRIMRGSCATKAADLVQDNKETLVRDVLC